MVTPISVHQLADRIDAGDSFALLDTRPADSFEAWHAPGARHFPFDPSERLEDRREDLEAVIGDDDNVITICGKGVSSGTLGALLTRATDAYDVSAVTGGMNAWSVLYHHVEIPPDVLGDGSLEIVQLQRRAKGCLSYLVADTDTGQALVVDPTADLDEPIRAAGERGLAIQGVVDTHVHADHVSGGRHLADRLGVPYYLPKRAADRDVTHAFEPLEDGQVLSLGDIEVRVEHTPGHTSEMCSLVVDDQAVFTADTLHVDAVGRTELEFGDEDASKGAQLLYQSIHEELLSLPDDCAVLPGHVAVGTDGRFRGGTPRDPILTTIGAARRDIELLGVDRETFLETVVDAGDKPENYEEIIAHNRGETAGLPGDRVALEVGPNNCSA